MKKLIEKVLGIGFAFAIVFGIAACGENSGLGSAVDTEVPTVSVTYPPVNAIIRDTFVLSGPCNDDKGVKRVVVAIQNVDTKSTDYPVLNATIAKDRKSWSVEVNNFDEAMYPRTNGWQLEDGNYLLTVSAKDDAGHTSQEYTHSVTIDNTAPIFVISSPGTAQISEATEYGAVFSIAGSVHETSKVSKGIVNIYEDAELQNKINDAPFVFESPDTSNGLRETIGQNYEEPTEEEAKKDTYKLYSQVYKWATDNGKVDEAGTAKFYCTVELVDTAKEYKGENVSSSGGNTNNGKVYFSDPVRTTITNSPDFSQYDSDLFKNLNFAKVVNGTDTLLSDADRTNFLSKLEAASTKLEAFSINPDANPTYQCSSAYFKKSAKNSEIVFSEIASNSALTFIVKAGRDKDNIDPATLVTYQFGPYDDVDTMREACAEIFDDPEKYYQKTQNGTVVLESVDKNESPTVSDTRPSGFTASAEQFTFQVNTFSSIKSNQYYIVAMTGADVEGKELRPEAGYYYAFRGSTLTVAPVVSVDVANNKYFNTTKLSLDASATSADSSTTIRKVEWSGSVSNQTDGETGTYNIPTKVLSFDDGDLTPRTDSLGQLKPYEVDFTIDLDEAEGYNDWISELGGEGGKYYSVTLNVQATDASNNKSIMKEYTFYIDTKAPAFSLSDTAIGDENSTDVYYIGNTDLYFNSGTSYILRGDWSDNGQGVADCYYQLVDGHTSVTDYGTSAPWVKVSTSSNTKNLKIEEAIPVNKYCAKTLVLYGVDKQGNKSKIYNYKVQFDFDSPVVNISTSKTETNGDIVVTATVTEDLLKSAVLTGTGANPIVKEFTASELAAAKSGTTYTLTYTLSVASCNEGATDYNIVVKDYANGEESPKKDVSVLFDKTAPQFSLDLLENNANIFANEVGGKFNSYIAVDKTDPTKATLQLSGTWRDLDATSAKNAGAGVDKLYYSFTGNDGDWHELSGVVNGITKNTPFNTSIEVTEDKTALHFKAVDKVENESAVTSFTGLKIDFAAPTLELGSLSKTTAKAGEKVTFTVTSDATSDSGTITVKGYKKATENGTATEQSASTYTFTPSTGTVEVEAKAGGANDGFWHFDVTATDKNGRKTTKTTSEFTIDATSPVFTSMTVGGQSNYTTYRFNSDTLTIIPVVSDATSGLSKMHWKVTKSTDPEPAKTDDGWAAPSISENSDVTAKGFKDGKNKLWIYYSDRAGNETDVVGYEIEVDKTYPEIGDLTLSSEENGEAVVSSTGPIWVRGEITETSNLSAVAVRVYDDGKEVQSATKTFTATELATLNATDTGDGKKKVNVGFNFGSGTYKFRIDATDIAGNDREGRITKESVLIDKTAPVILTKITENGVEVDAFNIKSTNKNLYADEGEYKNLIRLIEENGTSRRVFDLQGWWSDVSGSGTKLLEYRWGDSGNFTPFPDNLNSVTNASKFTVTLPIEEGKSQKLYLRATDDAGNPSVPVSIDGITIDFSKPTIDNFTYKLGSGTFPTSGQKYVNGSNGTLTIETTVRDSFKLSSASVTATKDGNSATGGFNATIGSGDKDRTVTITLTPSSGSNEGTWVFTVTGTDDNGRTVTSTTESIIVDVTKPTLTGFKLDNVDDFANTYLNGTTLTPTGTITETGGSKLSHLTYQTRDNLAEKTQQFDDEATSFPEPFTGFGEGTNNLTVKIYDKAGNFAELKQTVMVDLYAPEVTISDPTSDGSTAITSASKYVYFTTEIVEGSLKDVSIDVFANGIKDDAKSVKIENISVNASNASNVVSYTPSKAGIIESITYDKSGENDKYIITSKFTVDGTTSGIAKWNDATYKVKVEAHDRSYGTGEGKGIGTSLEKSFLVDTRSPKIAIDSANLTVGASAENVIYADAGTRKNYISIDTNDPTKATYSVKGTWSDLDSDLATAKAGSGTSQMFYSWTTSDVTAASGWTAFPDAASGVTAEKTFSVDLPVTQTAANETRTLYIYAQDVAGNKSDAITIGGIKIDFEKPVVYIAKEEGISATDDLGFDLSGENAKEGTGNIAAYVKAGGTLILNAKAIDNYGGLTADNVTVVVKKDGSEITPNGTTQKVTKTASADGKVIDVKVEVVAGTLGGGSNDGKWTVEIYATDANGRRSDTKTTKTAIVDATPPGTVTDMEWGSKKVDSALLSSTYFNSNAISVSGWAKDVMSEVENIICTVTPEGESAVNNPFNAGVNDATRGNSLSASLSGFKAGENTVSMKAVDKAGNEGTALQFTVLVDMGSPMFKGFNPGDGNILTNRQADITISGEVSDDMAVSEVYFTLANKTYKPTYNEAYPNEDKTGTKVTNIGLESEKIKASYKYITYTILIPAADLSSVEDDPQIMATVVDKAGNSSGQSVCTLVVDSVPPTYEVSTATKDLNGIGNIIGTANDNKTPASFELYYAKAAAFDSTAQTSFTTTVSEGGTMSDSPAAHGWTKVQLKKTEIAEPVEKYTSTSDIYNWKHYDFDWTTLSDAASKVDGNGKHTGVDTIYLLPVIIDKAGNSNAYTVAYNSNTKTTTYTWDLTEGTNKVTKCDIDLNADKPIVKFENLDSEKILRFGTEATIRGSVSDDDGIVSTFIIASAPITKNGSTFTAGGTTILSTTSGTKTTWKRNVGEKSEETTFDTASGKWEFKPADVNDGTKDIYFYVIDKNNGEFYTGHSNNLFMPKAQYNDQIEENASDVTEKITYNSDSNAPKVTYIEVASSDTVTFTPGDADWKMFSAADSVGGKLKRYVKFRITSYDANGIAGMAFTLTDKNKDEVKKLDSKTSGDFTTAEIQAQGESEYSNSTWITKAIDLGGMDGVPSGLAELNAEPLDNSGMKGGLKMSIYVDNEVDMGSFKLSSPKADGDAQISEVTLSGIANENNGSGIAKVSWIVPKKGMTAASVAEAVKAGTDTEANGYKWQSNLAVGSSYSAWQFICDGTTKNNERFDTYANDTTNYALTNNNFIFTMPVYFKVEDNLGNVAVSTDSTFLYNPNGNIPTARIVYPLTGEKDPVTAKIDHTRVGTNLRITGSATDNDKVKEVFVQLALTAKEDDPVNWSENDTVLEQEQSAGGSSYLSITGLSEAGIVNVKGSAHESSMMTVDTDWWGIKAAGTTSWYLVVNSYGKFNKQYLHFRVCATDYDGYACVWSEEQVVYVDDDVPVIGATAYLAQFTDNTFATETARIPFSQDMYISGKTGDWYLVVSATDTAGIKSTGVTEKIGGNSATNATYTAKDWTTSGVQKDANAKSKDKLIYIKLSTDVSTSVMYTISAVEDTENLKQGSYTCTVKIDNEAPKMEELLADGTQDVSKNKVNGNKLQNSNGRVRLNSSLEEADSGFAFLAYQFVKKGDSKVYNPIPKLDGGKYVRQDATGTAIGGLTLDSGLYGKAYTNVAISNGNELTINDASTNGNIRKGGIVKVSGKYYLITNVAGTKVTVDAVGLKGSANVFVPYALAVNYNSEGGITTESATGSFSSGYTVNEDDGDGIVEAVNKNSGIYKWEASIMSDCLADGEYEMRLTAFDNAGNYSTIVDWTGSGAKFNTFIANHEPRLAKIYLATDLNSNGKYSDDEFAYKNNVNGGDIDTYFYSALDGMNNEQEVVNLVTEGLDVDKAAKFSVRNGLAIGFEFVAGKEGQTGLDYIAKLGTEGATEPATGAIKAQVGSSTAAQFTGPKDGGTRQVPAVMKSIIMDNATIKGLPGYAATMENKTDSATGKTALVTKTYAQISLWDRASGTQGGTADVKNADGYYTTYGNQFTVINIPVYLDTDDDQDPVSSIDKLTVENVQVNGDEAPLGHVEVGADLPAALFKMTGTDYTTYRNGLMDRNDKVSGEIFFTGKVSDNNYVKSLVLNIGDATTQNGNNNTKKLKADKVTVAEFNTTNGTLDFKTNYGNEKDNYATNGWYIVKGEETFTQDSGHVVEWTLYIDTSKVTNGGGTRIFAATDVTLGMTASDGNATALTNYTPYTVDIVPYITSVERGEYNSTATKVYNEVKYQRSKFGEYAVVENETVTVRGFNFSSANDGTTVKVGDNNAENKTAAIAGTNTTKNTKSARDDYATNCSFTMTVPSKSGEMVVTVGGVESLNDKNNNEAENNIEINDYYKAGTMKDNRYLNVWNLGNYFKNTDNGAELQEPVMTADKNGNLFASWVAQSNSNVMLSYGVNKNSTAVYRNYDQPATTTAISFDRGTSGGLNIGFIPEHQGNGGTFSNNALSSAIIVGGAATIQVKQSDIDGDNGNGTVRSGQNVNVPGNPKFKLDKDNSSNFWNLANYDANRRLGSFEAPHSARYNNLLHNIWYDNVTHSLKYSVVDANDTVADRTGNSKYMGNNSAGAIAGWVVIDGGYTGQDRVHSISGNSGEKNNTLSSEETYHSQTDATGTTYSTDIFIASGRRNAGTNEYRDGDATPTSFKYKNLNSSFNPATGMTVALLQNTEGNYAISYRTIKNVSDNTITWDGAVDHAIHSVAVYNGNMNVVAGTATANYNSFARPTGQSNDAGSSSSIDIDSHGHPVVAYVDSDGSTLRVAWSIKETAADLILASNWSRMPVPNVSCAGEVSMKMDSEDNVHIMYQNADGALCYIKGKHTGDNITFGAEEVIDTQGSLSYGALSVLESGTGVTKVVTPVVTYINTAGTAQAIKYAKRTSSEEWDVQIVPSTGSGHYALKDNQLSLEARKAGWTGTGNVLRNGGTVETATPATVNAAIAFKSSTAFETAYLKKE